MRYVLLTLALIASATAAMAEAIIVKVDGMVCAFCASGIEQLFTDEPGVKTVHVDLDASTVELSTDDATPLSDTRIRELITKSGFDAGEITRK